MEGPEEASFIPEATIWNTVGAIDGRVAIGDNDVLVLNAADAGKGSLRDAITSLQPVGGGLVTFDTTARDPEVTYEVVNIDGEKPHVITVKRSQLTFK